MNAHVKNILLWVFLFIVAVNGSPSFFLVANATLDVNGSWTLSGTVGSVPPGTLTLRTFSLAALNRVIRTNDLVLSFF